MTGSYNLGSCLKLPTLISLFDFKVVFFGRKLSRHVISDFLDVNTLYNRVSNLAMTRGRCSSSMTRRRSEHWIMLAWHISKMNLVLYIYIDYPEMPWRASRSYVLPLVDKKATEKSLPHLLNLLLFPPILSPNIPYLNLFPVEGIKKK